MDLIFGVDQVELLPNSKWVLLCLPVVQEVEEAKAWHEEEDHGGDPPQGPHQSPQEDSTFCLESKESLLKFYCLQMQHHTGLEAPQRREDEGSGGCHGDAQEGVLLEECLESRGCGRLCQGHQEQGGL